jgi:hypothetical protein
LASTPTLHVDLPVPTFIFFGAPLKTAENCGFSIIALCSKTVNRGHSRTNKARSGDSIRGIAGESVSIPFAPNRLWISCSGFKKIRIQILVGARHQIIDLGKEFTLTQSSRDPVRL